MRHGEELVATGEARVKTRGTGKVSVILNLKPSGELKSMTIEGRVRPDVRRRDRPREDQGIGGRSTEPLPKLHRQTRAMPTGRSIDEIRVDETASGRKDDQSVR